MNILILDEDPKKSAEYHCDMHIKSFVLNYSQLLSSCHWISLYNKEEEKIKALEERINKLNARIVHMEQFINKLKEVLK